jgi:hypothetical protein
MFMALELKKLIEDAVVQERSQQTSNISPESKNKCEHEQMDGKRALEKKERSRFHQMVAEDNIEEVKSFLKDVGAEGIAPLMTQDDSKHLTPLHTALLNIPIKENDEMWKLLLPILTLDMILGKRGDEISPVMIALYLYVFSGKHSILTHFVSSPQFDKDERLIVGRTLLQFAAYNSELDLVRLLLQQGTSVNIPRYPTSIDQTPLFFACQRLSANEKQLAIVDCLLAGGAKISMSDERGQTPLNVARNPDIKNRLLNVAAQEGEKEKGSSIVSSTQGVTIPSSSSTSRSHP